ncbi:GntR family transcriptional regulator [Anaerocellum diazotrophicum]|uniref:HTH-type transcriptional repressor YtrA n=1 Tax=Caldicellulosiruptor diazotrophicus TaxID=2806205 RepID=A0ABM7NJX1_9FIRM|nr:GntR family transcriptional regulator [Caldicellulosiruptor diazotrophicus]BCS80398.1 HTH-type transcriptional repressor YtrA [Caldicellulosiruptor diazotrophicus]
MFEVDWKSRTPIYEQIVEKIKELIIKEVLKENEQLPSVRALSKELSVNPNTIQKAYRELEREGFIYSIPGKGNFVVPVKAKINAKKLSNLKEELKKILQEAFFLGLSKEELMEIVDEVESKTKGGTQRD